ncbi:fungal-specific transcription factor [Thelonectria olida]|uniref:Fungal-specific transcription factor n=1 Tax=Thelonectria olida TaxID=1576542 RepID=A0A9P9AJU0_9HYPO|nr:fungal-specific transcription factor [Thelonectria olida]
MRKYMSKRQRPCDFCRSRKTACRIDDAPPCRSCQLHDRECTFVEAARPRKRQATDANIESHSEDDPHQDAAGPSGASQGLQSTLQRALPEPSPLDQTRHEDEAEEPVPADASFADMSMHFLHNLDMDGSEYQFMFRTPRSPASNMSVLGDAQLPTISQAPSPGPPSASSSSNILIDGVAGFNPETLGLTGDMDPYLLQRYQTDHRGIFKFKQLAIHSVQPDPLPTQFLVSQPSLFSHSREEAGHTGIQDSEQREKLEKYVSESMGKRLIALYQKFIAPHYPIFSTQSLPDPASSPPHLLAAIYSITFPFAMYDDQLCIDLAYESPPYEPWARIINQGVAADTHSPTLATAQTLLLLVARSSSNHLVSDASYRWTNMGVLVSTAVNIGLHLDPSTWKISPAQISQRRRLSFSIYAIDRWLAATLGRPPHIDNANWLVTSLKVDDSHCAGISSDHWADLLAVSSVTSVLASTLASLYSLRAVHSLLESPEKATAASTGLIQTLDESQTCFSTSPEALERTSQTTSSFVVSLSYYYTRLLILRAGLRSMVHGDLSLSSANPESSPDDFNLRAKMKDCVEKFSAFVQGLHSDDIAGLWPPWCQTAFSSLCFALLLMMVSSSTSQEASSWLEILHTTRRNLRLKANSLPVLRLSLLRVDSIFWRGVDKVLKLKPHVEEAVRTFTKPL